MTTSYWKGQDPLVRYGIIEMQHNPIFWKLETSKQSNIKFKVYEGPLPIGWPTRHLDTIWQIGISRYLTCLVINHPASVSFSLMPVFSPMWIPILKSREYVHASRIFTGRGCSKIEVERQVLQKPNTQQYLITSRGRKTCFGGSKEQQPSHLAALKSRIRNMIHYVWVSACRNVKTKELMEGDEENDFCITSNENSVSR